MRRTTLLIPFLFLASALMIPIPGGVEGSPSIIQVIYSPLEPTVEDELNITMLVDPDGEVIDRVWVEFCINNVCYPPLDLHDDGSGTTFSIDYPNDHFANATGKFNITVSYGGGAGFLYHEFHLEFAALPTAILLDPISIDRTTFYPGRSVGVSGNAKYDTGKAIEQGVVNLSIEELGLYNGTMLGENGDFNLSLTVETEGVFDLELNVSSEELSAVRTWEITVNSWPIPVIGVNCTMSYDPLDGPPGEDDVVYSRANITIEYILENTGTGPAHNITVNITKDEAELDDLISVGTLDIGEYYEDELQFFIDEPGNYSIEVAIEWDQMAPLPDGYQFPNRTIPVRIVDRPIWEPHRPLVELFTSTTCEYCVYAEEALERIMEDDGVDLTYIAYITDDGASNDIARARGIVATPVVKIDHEFITIDEVSGDGSRIEQWDRAIRGSISEAVRRDTPPLVLEYQEGSNGSRTLDIILPSFARGSQSFRLKVIEIERASDLRRNHQGVPMGYRYMKQLLEPADLEMEPGDRESFELNIGEGMGAVAVLYDDNMNVLDTRFLFPYTKEEYYLEKGTIRVDIETPGRTKVPLRIESFSFFDGMLQERQIELWAENMPSNWTLSHGGEGISLDTPFSLSTGSVQFVEETLEVGRIRYTYDLDLTVNVADNTSGLFSFNMVLSTAWRQSVRPVIVKAERNMTIDGENRTAIKRVWLTSSEGNLYLNVEVENLPPGAIIKGWVQYCQEGEGGYCSAGDVFPIASIDGIHNASVPKPPDDINLFTHIGYRAFIEVDGDIVLDSNITKEALSEHIPETDAEDGDGGPDMAVFGALAVLILIILVVVVLAVVRIAGKEGEETPDTGKDVSDGYNEERLDSMMEDFPLPPTPMEVNTQLHRVSERGGCNSTDDRADKGAATAGMERTADGLSGMPVSAETASYAADSAIGAQPPGQGPGQKVDENTGHSTPISPSQKEDDTPVDINSEDSISDGRGVRI